MLVFVKNGYSVVLVKRKMGFVVAGNVDVVFLKMGFIVYFDSFLLRKKPMFFVN